MALRFRRTVKIAPGIKLNLGKTGGSVSLGRRGSTVTVGKGGVFANVGAPGTGLSWRTKVSGAKKTSKTRKGMTAAQKRALNVAKLQEEAQLYNTGVEEGINQHRKVMDISSMQRWKDIRHFLIPESAVNLVAVVIWIALLVWLIPIFPLGALVAGCMLLQQIYFFGKHYRLTRKTKRLFKAASSGDRESISSVIEMFLHNMDWFRETTPNFEISQDSTSIYMDVDLPEIEDMPDCIMVVKKTEQAMYKKFKKKKR